MTDIVVHRNPTERAPLHPGAVLDDVIPDVGKSKTEIASLLGISRQYLYAVLDGKKPLSPAMAARIAKAFGGSTASWLRMQAAYDAWHAERDVDVSHIPVLTAA